jgi:hypothetical protein
VRTLDGSEPTALATYESERDAACGRLFDITDIIAGLKWDLDELKQLHLELSHELTKEAQGLASPAAGNR